MTNLITPDKTSLFRRWLLLPLILAGVHSAIVLAAILTGELGRTYINGPAWVFFGIIDYPESWLIWKLPGLQPPIFFLTLGFFHWGLIGLGIQSIWNWFRREKVDA